MISKVSLIVSVVLISCLSASATSCTVTGSTSTVSWQWWGVQSSNGSATCSAALTTSHDGVYYPTSSTTQAGYKINSKVTAGTWNVLTDSAGGTSNPEVWNGWHGGSLSNLYVCSGATCVSNPGAGSSTSNIPGITIPISASLVSGNNLATAPPPYHRIPTNEDPSVYYMNVPDNSGLTIKFGTVSGTPGNYSCTGCITKLAFYWGSMDPGNRLIFKNLDGSTATIDGASFYNSNYLTFANNPNNTESYESYFYPTQTTGASAWWQSVTFYACGYTYTPGNANPYAADCTTSRNSFEFDNLEWQVTACNRCASPIPGPSPTAVPEPIELPAALGALVTMCSWLKRRARIA